MIKLKSIVAIMGVLSLAATNTTGCDQNQANMVSYNLSQEADNFNVVRQLTVINCIQGDVLFQMTGKMSITADTSDNQLEIIVEDEEGNYQKHFIGLSDNVTYTLEQKGYKDVSNYNFVRKAHSFRGGMDSTL